MHFYIRHLPLNKHNSFADALEWIAELKVPRVVLPYDMSRTGGSSTGKVRSYLRSDFSPAVFRL